MRSTSGRAQGAGGRIWVLTAMLVSALVLSGACSGKDSSSTATTQTGAGASPGAADGSVSGVATAAAGSATDLARAVATAQATAAAQAQASGVDPCRVATKEELEAALGFPLGPGERGTSPIGAAQCAYKAQFPRAETNLPNVTVAVYRSRLAPATYEGMREGSSRLTDVPGLGDKAFVMTGSGLLDVREIYVLRGDVLLSIDVQVEGGPNNPARMGEEEKRAKLIALARTALGRI